MRFKPILFNTDMVKAILQGRKTQTRRIVKPHYHKNECGYNVVTNAHTGAFCYIEYYDWNERPTERYLEPPYYPGDILWVRETWCNLPVSPGGHTRLMRGRYYYKADVPDIRPDGWRGKWKPSIHMPKEAARLFISVKKIRCEKLNDISDDDILAEGVLPSLVTTGEPITDSALTAGRRMAFRKLWDSTIPKEKLVFNGWAANPRVWVFEFRQTDKPEEWL